MLNHEPAQPDPVPAQSSLQSPLDAPPPGLVPFCFWLPRAAGASADERIPPDPAALRGAIAAHLSSQGWPDAEPLRWAITEVHALRGLQIEGVGWRVEPPSHTSR